MISKSLQCVYIHIPKTGGTSIESKLGFHHGDELKRAQDHRRLRNVESGTWPPSRNAFGPVDFLHFLNQRLKGVFAGFDSLTYSEYCAFYKFAIVRNPWDRIYSWYRNVLRDPSHQKELGVISDCDFAEFVNGHLDIWALNSQLDWIVDSSGEVAVDFVGRFESLQDSFDQIGRTLGISDTELPVLLHSGNADYRKAYSTALVDIIATKYEREISMFDYSFE